MKTFTLTEAETNELRQAHRSSPNKRDADRINAVYLLSRGKSAREIAEVLMLDEDTVGHYRKRYEAGGVAELLAGKLASPVLRRAVTGNSYCLSDQEQ